MNNKKSIIVSVALAATMLATSISAFAYTDVSADHWAKSYVDSLSGQKYLNGYEDGTFRPDNLITRAEFAKVLTNIFGVIDKSGVTIADIDDSKWYADTMKIAVKAGYLSGYSDGTVRPEENITRQEAAVMVYRAWQLSPEGYNNFTDNSEIADWAANEIATLTAKEVINGYEDGSFRPTNHITRAEAAKILAKAITLGVTKAGTNVTSAGTTSGALHVGSVSRASSGGGGGSGRSTSTTTVSDGTTTTPKNIVADVVGVDNADADVTAISVDATALESAVDAAIADNSNAVEKTTPVNLKMNLTGINDGDYQITFTLPGGTEKTVASVAEFNKAMEEADITAEQVADVANSVKIVPTAPTTESDVNNIGVTFEVATVPEEGQQAETVVNATAAATENKVNYVITSLKAFQKGNGDNQDLVIVMKSYEDGAEANEVEANVWLEDNARRTNLYKDVINAVLEEVYYDVEISEDNYDQYVDLFNSMKKIVDNTVEVAVSLADEDDLTEKTVAEYFQSVVSPAIDEAVQNAGVEKSTAADLKGVAKAFGTNFISLLKKAKTTVDNAESNGYKEDMLLDLYNANR